MPKREPTDTELMDWMERRHATVQYWEYSPAGPPSHWSVAGEGSNPFSGLTLRYAIDKAMKAERR